MKSKENKEKKERTIPVIYVGETIRHTLKKYNVYTNGIPSNNLEIRNLLEECPKLEKLFIPVHELNDWEQKVKQDGSLELFYYKTVADYFAKKKEKEGV